MNTRDPKGRKARSPWRMPWHAWKEVIRRTWNESWADNTGLLAAGTAFYGFLALVPLLGATVLTYGLIASPDTVVGNVERMTRVMPAEAARLIGEQLASVVKTSAEKKGLGLVLALAIALYGVQNAASGMISALNVVYEEKEKRSMVKVTLLAFALTIAAVLFAVVAILAVAAFAALDEIFPFAGEALLGASRALSYLLLGLLGAAVAASLYKFGPSREDARWEWLTPGSVLFGLAWVLLTLGFGFYVANFGNYGATYGSLSAIVVLLTWMYLSSYALLLGAEFNAELEHQTARDTTDGKEEPLGERGAWVADHVAGED